MTLSTSNRAEPRLRAAQWPTLSRTVGTAFGSVLALALLTCGCVFAALAGPAISLHTRTQALHQTLAGFPNTTKTVQASSTLAQVAEALQVNGNGQPGPVLSESALAQSTSVRPPNLRARMLPRPMWTYSALLLVP